MHISPTCAVKLTSYCSRYESNTGGGEGRNLITNSYDLQTSTRRDELQTQIARDDMSMNMIHMIMSTKRNWSLSGGELSSAVICSTLIELVV